MFDRFTDRARKSMGIARLEAQRLDHDYIGTEHMLLGLVEASGVGASALKNLGIKRAMVRDEVERRVSPGTTLVTIGQLPFTPRGKKALELSLAEAIDLGHAYIGSEHLLLGLIREGEGIAAQALEALGVSADAARKEVIKILASELPDASKPRGTAQGALRMHAVARDSGSVPFVTPALTEVFVHASIASRQAGRLVTVIDLLLFAATAAKWFVGDRFSALWPLLRTAQARPQPPTEAGRAGELSPAALAVFGESLRLAGKRGHTVAGLPELLEALLSDDVSDVRALLKEAGIDVGDLRSPPSA